jgi:hypothetical protein
MLDEDSVARTDEHVQRDRDSIECTGRDEDLLGRGRQPTCGVPLRYPRPQLRQTGRIVAVAGQHPWEIGQCRGERGDDLRRGRRRGVCEIENPGGGQRRRPGAVCGSSGQRRPGPRALPGAGPAVLAQSPVGGGDRGPAQLQCSGELPLGRQPDSDRQSAVPNKQPDARGQRRVARRTLARQFTYERSQRCSGTISHATDRRLDCSSQSNHVSY